VEALADLPEGTVVGFPSSFSSLGNQTPPK